MKKFLQNLISRKEQEIANMRQRVKDSNDINEVRSLGEQIEGMVAELYAGPGAVRKTLHKYVSNR